MTIIVTFIARKSILHQSIPSSSTPDVANIFNVQINPKITQFQPSTMTPSSSLFGYEIIKQLQFNYTSSTDYIQNTEIFNDYASFKMYSDTLETVDINNRGIANQIINIIEWVLSITNQSITSFNAGWQFVVSTQLEHDVAVILESETSFYEKDFMQYLLFLLNNDICTESTNPNLLTMVDTFANKQFMDIVPSEIINENVASFGGGIGFGLQIYCDDALIFDGGAGGGGGYNVEDFPNIFEYGGGGGIQINNVTIGGGTGFETDQYVLDPNTDCDGFYGKGKEYFETLFIENKCDKLVVSSGGGSGSGFTTNNNDTDLVSWSYYFVNITLM